jgi:hypothetical protein
MHEPDLQEQGAKHGARVYAFEGGVILVKQTVKRGAGHRERHVDPGNDSALGAAVRAATEGRL